MTLAEVAEKVRGLEYGPHGSRDLALAVVERFESDPDFTAGPELRALRERLERLIRDYEWDPVESGILNFPSTIEFTEVARRLREVVGG